MLIFFLATEDRREKKENRREAYFSQWLSIISLQFFVAKFFNQEFFIQKSKNEFQPKKMHDQTFTFLQYILSFEERTNQQLV
jgi:hypothetical protein